jgi:hypothetical protein
MKKKYLKKEQMIWQILKLFINFKKYELKS